MGQGGCGRWKPLSSVAHKDASLVSQLSPARQSKKQSPRRAKGARRAGGCSARIKAQTQNTVNRTNSGVFPPSRSSLAFALLREPSLSIYLPLSLLPPAKESISTGSISWHEYSLPAESLVGERRRLRLRRRQRRKVEGWGRRRERKMHGEINTGGFGNYPTGEWSFESMEWTAILGDKI